MPFTPEEIRNVELRGAFLGGYRRRGVEDLLNGLAENFEEVWRERCDFSDRIQELEVEAALHRELEGLLRSTLLSAKRAADGIKEQAYRESDLIVREAHAESRRVTREASAEKRRLEDDMARIRGLLRAALEVVAERPSDQNGKPENARPAPTTVEEVGDSRIRKVAG